MDTQFEARVYSDIKKRGFKGPVRFTFGNQEHLQWDSVDPSCKHSIMTLPISLGTVWIGMRGDVHEESGLDKMFYPVRDMKQLRQFMSVFHKLGKTCEACSRRYGAQV
jgi:hypothetical protein